MSIRSRVELVVEGIRNWKIWDWSGPRWFGFILGIFAMFLISYFSSWLVGLGVFLWTWAINIDNSGL